MGGGVPWGIISTFRAVTSIFRGVTSIFRGVTSIFGGVGNQRLITLCTNVNGLHLTLVMMGPYVPPQSVFIFLPKISPPDQTLRPTCKFLLLGLLYHEFFFSENLVYKKVYYINS